MRRVAGSGLAASLGVCVWVRGSARCSQPSLHLHAEVPKPNLPTLPHTVTECKQRPHVCSSGAIIPDAHAHTSSAPPTRAACLHAGWRTHRSEPRNALSASNISPHSLAGWWLLCPGLDERSVPAPATPTQHLAGGPADRLAHAQRLGPGTIVFGPKFAHSLLSWITDSSYRAVSTFFSTQNKFLLTFAVALPTAIPCVSPVGSL
jgi:hypothetical protein